MIEDTTITRRRLLVVGGAAAVTAMIPATAHAGSSAVTKASCFERGTYNSRVGQGFGMSHAGVKTTLTLKAVLDLQGKARNGRPLAGRNDAFLLIFEGPPGSAQFQDTRLFTHPDLGQHALFVSGSAP